MPAIQIDTSCAESLLTRLREAGRGGRIPEALYWEVRAYLSSLDTAPELVGSLPLIKAIWPDYFGDATPNNFSELAAYGVVHRGYVDLSMRVRAAAHRLAA